LSIRPISPCESRPTTDPLTSASSDRFVAMAPVNGTDGVQRRDAGQGEPCPYAV